MCGRISPLPILVVPVIPRYDRLALFELPSFWSPHQIAVYGRLQIVAHLHPLLAWVSFRRVHVEGVHVRKAMLLIAGFAIIG